MPLNQRGISNLAQENPESSKFENSQQTQRSIQLGVILFCNYGFKRNSLRGKVWGFFREEEEGEKHEPY